MPHPRLRRLSDLHHCVRQIPRRRPRRVPRHRRAPACIPCASTTPRGAPTSTSTASPSAAWSRRTTTSSRVQMTTSGPRAPPFIMMRSRVRGERRTESGQCVVGRGDAGIDPAVWFACSQLGIVRATFNGCRCWVSECVHLVKPVSRDGTRAYRLLGGLRWKAFIMYKFGYCNLLTRQRKKHVFAKEAIMTLKNVYVIRLPSSLLQSDCNCE